MSEVNQLNVWSLHCFPWFELIHHFLFWQHETRVLRVKVIAGIDLAKKDIIGARWASPEILPSPKGSLVCQTDITVCLLIAIFWRWYENGWKSPTQFKRKKNVKPLINFYIFRICQCPHHFHYQLWMRNSLPLTGWQQSAQHAQTVTAR